MSMYFYHKYSTYSFFSFIFLACFSLPALSEGEVRIMPLGDSITRGAQAYDISIASNPESAYRIDDEDIPNDLRSYREHLHDLLTQPSCEANIEWVGSDFFDGRIPTNHEGHGGWRADQILDAISEWLVDNKPSLILLNIGTNDLIQGNTAESTEQDILSILDAIDEYETSQNVVVPVFIGNMVPIIGWHATHDHNGNFNDTEVQRSLLSEKIVNFVQSRQSLGDAIELVDINSGFYVDEGNIRNCVTGEQGNPDNMMMTRCQAHLPPNSPDGLHPNLLGDRFLAQQFSSALQTHADICGVDQTINTNPIVSISNPSSHDVTLTSNITFTGSAEEYGISGLKDVLIYIRDRDNKTWHSTAVPTTLEIITNSTANWSYNISLPPGNYTVFMKARDNQNNISELLGRRFTIPEDTQDPRAEFSNPSSHDVVLPSNLTFTGSATDVGSSGLKNVLIYIRDRDAKTWHSIAKATTLNRISESTSNWSYSISLQPGSYAVFVKAWDNAGNTSTRLARRFTVTPHE